MILAELKQLLFENPEAAITIQLPDGGLVPSHFHVTEVGLVKKDFIDCGGTRRSSQRCQLQLWVANDTEHRIDAAKLLQIISLGQSLLGSEDLEVDFEYSEDFISQFPLTAADCVENRIVLSLGGRTTDCLAKDRCGIGSDCC